eukprot:127809-Rhodomonas_salina.1
MQVRSVVEEVQFSDPNQGTQIGNLVSLVRARKQQELKTYLKLEPSSVHCTDALSRKCCGIVICSQPLMLLLVCLQNGRTALHYAVLCKNHPAAEALVLAGIDVETTADDGKTASALAAEIPDSKMLKLLVDLRKATQREKQKYAHNAPGTPEGTGLPRRVPSLSKEKVISPHLSGANEVVYTHYFNKMDTKNRKVFVDSYEKNQNAERLGAITPETRVRMMQLQAENNAKITAKRTEDLRNSWTDPNTHSYML